MMTNQNLDYACDHSSFRINIPQCQVVRNDAINNINYHLKSRPNFIFISGETGIGKTVLLHQFIENTNKEKIIKLLLNPHSSFSKDIKNIKMDLCHQLCWLLMEQSPEQKNLDKESYYSSLVQVLSNKAIRNKFIFIVDGLSNKEMEGYRDEILELLPLHIPEITFILSNSDEKIAPFYKKILNDTSIKHLNYIVPILTKSEISELLQEFDDEKIALVFKTFSPIPRVLQMLRELIHNERSLANILDVYDEVNGDLFEMQWELNLANIDELKYEISIISTSPFKIDLNILEEHSKFNKDELNNKFNLISFVELNNEKATISSDGFKQFIKSKLPELYKDAIKTIEAISKKVTLPPSEKLDLLKHNLENENISYIIENINNKSILADFKNTSSTNFASKLLELKYEAGLLNKDIVEVLNTVHLLSITKSSSEISVLESELYFLLENEKFQAAFNLADKSVAIEDKIQMLSLVATSQKSKQGEADNNQINKIKFLLSQLENFSMNPELSLKIAASIFSIMPEESFNIIRLVDEFGASGSNQSDYIYARLYAENLIRNNEPANNIDLERIDLSDDIKDSIKQLEDSVKELDPRSFLEKIEAMDLEDGDKIKIISEILSNIKNNVDSHKALAYCLNLIVETTDYYLSCSTLRKLSYTFVNIENSSEVNDNLQRFDVLLNDCSIKGPSIDFVQASLNISEYEYKTKNELTRISNIFKYITTSIHDISHAFRATLAFEKTMLKLGINSFNGQLNIKKENYFDEIIKDSAQHFQLLKDAIKIQVSIDFVKALEWIPKINTCDRATRATAWAIKCYMEQEDYSFKSILRALKTIPSYKSLYARLLINLAERLKEKGLQDISKSDFDKFIKLKNKLVNNVEKSLFISNLIVGIDTNSELRESITDNKREVLNQELLNAFDSIDAVWNKVDYGYNIANILSSSSKATSVLILERVKMLQESDLAIKSKNIKNTYQLSISLAIRANNILLSNDIQKNDNLEVILNLIKNLGTSIDAVVSLAELSSSVQIHSSHKKSNDFIEKHLLDKLEKIGSEYTHEYNIAFYHASPVIYSYDTNLFENKLVSIENVDVHDGCLKSTIDYIFEKRVLNEPFYQSDSYNYKLSFSDVKSIFNLIYKFKSDWLIHSYLNRITNALKLKLKKNELSSAQQAEINSFYEKTINILPLIGGVKHDGYKILSKSLHLVFKNEKRVAEWKALINEAWNLGNLADSIFTVSKLLNIANILPLTIRKDELDTMISRLNNLNFTLEKLDLIEQVAHSCKEICKNKTKKLLENAINLSVEDHPDKFESKRKELIDAFYDIDPKLSVSLTSLHDNDPARKKSISKSIESKKKKESTIADFDKNGAKNLSKTDIFEFERYCINRLAKLNANKDAKMKKTEFFSKLNNLQIYTESSLHNIMSYLFQAYAQLFDHSKMTLEKEMQSIFDGIINNLYVVSNIYNIKTEQAIKNIHSEESLSLIGNDNDKEMSISFIRNWLDDNKIDSLIISEPYFSTDDFEFISRVIDMHFDKTITIITSIKVYDDFSALAKEKDLNVDEYLLDQWSELVCPDKNPRIEIIFVGTRENRANIVHDRWWVSLSGAHAIKIGTSINGIGSQLCSINKLSLEDSSNSFSILKPIIEKTQKEHKGKRVIFRNAMLD